MERLAAEWSFEADMQAMCPSADEAMARWWGQRARAAATPSTVRALIEMNSLVDVREVLPTVRVPTLVMHRRADQDSQVEEGRYLAEHIPGARFVELAGGDHFVAINPDQILDEVEAFLRQTLDRPTDRPLALAAILAGPALSEAMGLKAGRQARTATGDTVWLFDGPATAVRAARGLLDSDAATGLGLHVAEVSTTDGTVEGAGPGVAVALASAAPPGELRLTSIVKDLLAGSGIEVSPCGSLDQSPVYRLASL
jgi:hypothetical protein